MGRRWRNKARARKALAAAGETKKPQKLPPQMPDLGVSTKTLVRKSDNAIIVKIEIVIDGEVSTYFIPTHQYVRRKLPAQHERVHPHRTPGA